MVRDKGARLELVSILLQVLKAPIVLGMLYVGIAVLVVAGAFTTAGVVLVGAWFGRLLEGREAQLVVLVALYVVSGVLRWMKNTTPYAYAVLEMIVACLSALLAIQPEASPSVWGMKVIAAMYLMVRGRESWQRAMDSRPIGFEHSPTDPDPQRRAQRIR